MTYSDPAERRDPDCLPAGYLRHEWGGTNRGDGLWARIAIRVGAGFVALFVLFLVVSVFGAVTTPGNENFKAKWADWFRAHDASFLVNPLEKWYYTNSAPAKGGTPKGLNVIPAESSSQVSTTTLPSGVPTAAPISVGLPTPAPVPLVVSPALNGEGQWQATGPIVDGRAAMYVAQFRADDVYTSQITSAVWIDPARLSIRLVPGANEPGGTWAIPPDLTGAAEANAVAAFNGGFRFQDAHGGFYLDGRTAVRLQTGAESMVIYKDGHVDVGVWGSEITMTPSIEAVLQNLVPLVDGGTIASDATYNDTHIWGDTLGATTVVARSGLGVTANGALVYVAGPALTAKTLAESLQRAGAVRGMTLDINPEWVTFNFFTHPDPTSTVGTKLYPEMQRSPDRYLGPTQESRDFFTVSTS